MPGIFGFVGRPGWQDLGQRLRDMAAAMRHYPWYEEEYHLDDENGIGLGRLRLDYEKPSLTPHTINASSVVALVDGEIYDADQQSRALQSTGLGIPGHGAAELLAAGYAAKGEAFLRDVHGKFGAVLWDRSRKRLTLVSDRFGMQPLYYAHLPGRFLFASGIKALLTEADLSRQPAMKGIAQFFTFGQLLGEDTLLKEVRLLPAASCLTYDLDEDRIQLERYWRLGLTGGGHANDDEGRQLDRIDHAFGEAIRRRATSGSGLGLSLSGGLDSRTILGAINDDQPLTTICLGMPGSADHKAAAEMARLTNRPHHQCFLGANFLDHFEDHLRRMVRLTDGHYLSQCIVMPTLPIYRELGIQVLLRGHAGELLHMLKAYNFSLNGSALGLRDEAGLEDWLFRRLQAYLLEGTDDRLFAVPHRQAIVELARQSLRSCLGESEGLQPLVHRIWQMFMSQRLRRETAMSLVKFGSIVKTRLPYLDNDLVDALFAVPPELKLGETIQAFILRTRRPSLLRVTNVNTGARMNAGRLSRFVGGLKQRVLGKLGVRGYQPYERLGLWLRRELRPLVQKTLLADECLDGGLFDPNTMKKVVHDHFQGKNHTFLVMALLTYQIGRQELVSAPDQRPAVPAA